MFLFSFSPNVATEGHKESSGDGGDVPGKKEIHFSNKDLGLLKKSVKPCRFVQCEASGSRLLLIYIKLVGWAALRAPVF